MKYLKIIRNGLIAQNPTFVLILGMCPTPCKFISCNLF